MFFITWFFTLYIAFAVICLSLIITAMLSMYIIRGKPPASEGRSAWVGLRLSLFDAILPSLLKEYGTVMLDVERFEDWISSHALAIKIEDRTSGKQDNPLVPPFKHAQPA